jgi:uncharacterized protein (TIGR00255 family)
MTGFGKGTARCGDASVDVQLSAVNRKQQDIRINLPRELAPLESRLRGRLQEKISRGCVTAFFSYELGAQQRGAQIRIDEVVALKVAEGLRKLAAKAGLSGEIRMSDVLLVPGVLLDDQVQLPLDEIGELAVQALDEGLVALNGMQTREAEVLVQDLRARVQVMAEAVQRIKAARQNVLETYRDRLLERFQQLGVDLPLDDDRLAKEVVFLVERSDVTEEVVRLESHLAQMQELLGGEDEAGRKLEFICQEMNREINTLSAKTSNTAIASDALICKAELNRIKEQVMNIE